MDVASPEILIEQPLSAFGSAHNRFGWFAIESFRIRHRTLAHDLASCFVDKSMLLELCGKGVNFLAHRHSQIGCYVFDRPRVPPFGFGFVFDFGFDFDFGSASGPSHVTRSIMSR